ncbi:MAG: hypothetical protein ACRDM0_23140, partial [Thermoleophilaceae bacterium]
RTRLARFRICRWLAPRATPWREATRAWWLVLISWLIRATAIFLLLSTFGIALSFPLAIMFICAGAASAAIPIGPAGAATQVTAGATLLIVSGIEAGPALGFALAAQALLRVELSLRSQALAQARAPPAREPPRDRSRRARVGLALLGRRR